MNINYPNKKMMNTSSPTSVNNTFAKRGMSLESLLNQANDYYLAHNLACIYKKPTPIQVVQVDYKKRATARITEAYYRTPSTTDYNGVYDGKYIDFEAKQTNLTTLPFHNFHEHQIQHMEAVIKQQGLCFVIIYFQKKERFFLLPAIEVIRAYRSYTHNAEMKSISINHAATVGYEMTASAFPIIDYLAIIKKYF